MFRLLRDRLGRQTSPFDDLTLTVVIARHLYYRREMFLLYQKATEAYSIRYWGYMTGTCLLHDCYMTATELKHDGYGKSVDLVGDCIIKTKRQEQKS